MKSITGIPDEKKAQKDYHIPTLLKKVDEVLCEHGFVSTKPMADPNTGRFSQVYKGVEGSAIVTFVNDESNLIPLVVGDMEISKRPIYVERINVPGPIDISIRNDLIGI
jgi:hypothetical protein